MADIQAMKFHIDLKKIFWLSRPQSTYFEKFGPVENITALLKYMEKAVSIIAISNPTTIH